MGRKTIKKANCQMQFPWRKDQKQWTNSLLAKKFLQNPSLLTNIELATALGEHNDWRRSKGKYKWSNDPIDEGAEREPPFSADVIGRFIDEVCARLIISQDLAAGRFKTPCARGCKV